MRRPSNYDQMRDQMAREILRRDLRPAIRRFALRTDAGFLYLRFIGQDYRVSLKTGADFLGSERSYDLALITVFEDRASFDAYQTHPVHMPVKKRMHEVRSASVACDYEF